MKELMREHPDLKNSNELMWTCQGCHYGISYTLSDKKVWTKAVNVRILGDAPTKNRIAASGEVK
jgi:hypothetical protein